MNYRPTRSWVRRLGPLAMLIVGVTAFCFHMALANATPPIGNQDPACQSYAGFQSYHFEVDGVSIDQTRQRDEMQGKTHQNSVIDLYFHLKDECDNLYVGLNTYHTDGKGFSTDQDLFQRDARLFKADGTMHKLEVKNPPCFFQFDAYTGSRFKVGDYTHSGGPGFITADLGGGDNNCQVTTTTQKPTTTTEKPTTTTTERPTTTTTQVVVQNSADINPVCRTGSTGWSVKYTNKGTSVQTFVLSRGGDIQTVNKDPKDSASIIATGNKVLDTVKVDPGKSITKNYAFSDYNVARGESIDLRVDVGDKKLAALKVTNDCIGVDVNVNSRCNTEVGVGAVFTFTNSGKLDETFSVFDSAGTELSWSPVDVAAGKTVTKTQVVADHARTDFEIKGKVSGLDVKKGVTTNCVEVLPTTVLPTTTTTAPPQVLPETIVRPALAVTGFDLMPWMVFGSVLTLLGLALVLGNRQDRALSR